MDCSATLRNTRSKLGLGFSAPTSRAISMKRFDCVGSSGWGFGLRGMSRMIEAYNAVGGGMIVAAEEKPLEEARRYGVIDPGVIRGNVVEVKGVVEKPSPEQAPSRLCIIGRYILTPAIFDCLAKTPTGAGGELQLTDGMRMLLKQERMYAYVYEGKRYDTGDKLGFLKATVEFALKRSDLGGPFREYLQSLDL